MASSSQITLDTPITVKVNINGVSRRFKLPLRDVGANVLETKLRNVLGIPPSSQALFERYSDSAAAYVVLDQANAAVYKQLYRAAKAKQKLKLRVTVKDSPAEEKEGPKPASVTDEAEEDARPAVVQADAARELEEHINSAPSAAPQEQVAAEPAAPETDGTQVGHTLKLEESLPTTKDAVQPTSSDITYHTGPASGTGCPAMRPNYAVCCNSCDRTIPDAHYHCSTCDDGDFDLCQECVDRGITCKGPSHWLIKRFVKNGLIINSTTERLAPKPKQKPQSPEAPAPAPAAAERIIPVFNDFLYSSIRTCNCCVQELPEVEFVHCTTCDDFDLCRACFAQNRHGHHPGHAFVPAVQGTRLEPEVARRLSAGRGQPHNAICDGCDIAIRGIRHKCLDCPDWDYCSRCVADASFIHPGHRFVPIYEPLEYDGSARLRAKTRPVHIGICCDGPLCSGIRAASVYIIGDRYKCAVCNDTDFCAACEASPANTHNRTHPLIKFKTPVRHVSVTTTGENENGRQMPTMGDRPRPRPAAASPQVAETRTPPVSFTNVQTVVDVNPSVPAGPVKAEKEEAEVKIKKEEEVETKPLPSVQPVPADGLAATFVRDTVPDGTVFGPDHVFEQTWVLRNTGKTAWPAGCSVKFVGGDYMGLLDSNHPAATKDVEFSCESTICHASILPGEEFPFTVLLRTPHRSGRFVSNWRLTTKEGVKFGHRLWCDIVVEKPKVVLPPPAAAEAPKEEQEKKEAANAELEPQHSQMIFPKLEKESPVASMHEDAKTESVSAREEEYEDCGDEEWNDDESDEAFLTDEEYDILDASDEELLDGGSKQK
ncbi:hypothetical protein VTK56DRAFT_1054 [Thermocarpiscus australiensis]